jgi:membrane protein required for colicin V production
MDNLPVNIADIAVGAVLLISALFAYLRGFVHELLSVVGWIGAIVATIYGLPYLKPFIAQFISADMAPDLIGGTVIFVLTLAILSVITRIIAKSVQDSALNILDRSLGFLFGLARGAVLVCLAYIGVEWMIEPKEQPHWLVSARSMPLILTGADMLTSLVPEDMNGPAKPRPNDSQRKIDAQRAVDMIIAPQPRGAEKPSREGYGGQERRDMERLIETTK